MSGRRERRWALGALAALALLEAAMGLYGIDQPVRWGHQGYHVAEHGLGARNLLRHGAWTFTTYHGEGAPPAESFGFHHPVMLQVPVAALQSTFGESPWTARVVGFAFSFVALAGLFVFWRRARDDRQALVATALFVLSPMHVSFANLPDVQILGIAAACWLGALLVAQRARAPSRAGTIGLVALAAAGALADWAFHPVFWLAFVVFWWKARDGSTDLRRVLAFMGVAVVLVLVQHFGQAAALGRLDELQAAAEGRTMRPPIGDFLALVGRRLVHHHTLPILLVAAGWLVHAVRRRRDPGTMFVAAWLVAQLVYIYTFPNEFEYHEYRSYWLVVPFACATADALHALERRMRADWPLVARALPLLALATLCIRTVPLWLHSRDVSGCTSARTYDPQVALMTAARVGRALLPERAPVLLGAEPGQRLEVAWLLDRPSWTPRRPEDVEPLVERHPVVAVLDLGASLESSPDWHGVLRSAAVLLVDDDPGKSPQGGVALAVFRRGGTASVEHARVGTGRPWGALLAYLRAPVRGPPCLAPGDPAIAERYARDIGLPAAAQTRARAGRTPLQRTLPASLRCPAR